MYNEAPSLSLWQNLSQLKADVLCLLSFFMKNKMRYILTGIHGAI